MGSVVSDSWHRTHPVVMTTLHLSSTWRSLNKQRKTSVAADQRIAAQSVSSAFADWFIIDTDIAGAKLMSLLAPALSGPSGFV